MHVATSMVDDSPRFRRHLVILNVLVLLACAVSALVWLHPTLGYAETGALEGADLRSSLLQLLWCSLGAFAVGSTLTVAVLPAEWRAPSRLGAAYAIGLGVVVALFPALDHAY